RTARQPRSRGSDLRLQRWPRLGCRERLRAACRPCALPGRPRRTGAGGRRRCAPWRHCAHHVQRRIWRPSYEAPGAPAERRGRLIVYLHGFNSSPQSHKAQLMQRLMGERGLGEEFACPALPHTPRDAVRLVRSMAGDKPMCYIGSSLGGFYATYMVETHGGRAVLVNPAIEPPVWLAASFGPPP